MRQGGFSVNDDTADAWWHQLENEQERREFEEWLDAYDRETKMVDMSKYSGGESKFLKAKDFEGQNLKVVIDRLEEAHFEANDFGPATNKPILYFKGKERGLVVNASNVQILIEAYGSDSDSWSGRQIGLSTKKYEKGTGWIVTPLDVEPPEFNDDIPF